MDADTNPASPNAPEFAAGLLTLELRKSRARKLKAAKARKKKPTKAAPRKVKKAAKKLPKRKTKKSKTVRVVERTERLDMRITKAQKVKIAKKAAGLRRTVTSVVLEAIERMPAR